MLAHSQDFTYLTLRRSGNEEIPRQAEPFVRMLEQKMQSALTTSSM